ncbi:class I SAM-dependent methyltransferase [Mycolicibacterium neworleansense]|uniref:O-methyltransferase n=1 Tax=Mycolicibacterium neworleansense TaxID=146018 RepID=A0A0H5RWE3_9MYCO|nr:class I SAM-dependent methyltransferase [Mycolicibacterium neworleansense]MCV7360747.1 class I SAM-dependent methyltransferase [Mycolicibacterium neworleansense]CRZ18248.1 O-methyltransferase [Mycolicibacterium neworleansense]
MTGTSGKVSGSVLTGVSETALMTLQVRAHEARRADGLIDDPVAVQLVDSIDFDFAKFGYTRRQDMALRSLLFDRMTGNYLRDHPKATVVALAEGLQTSFYRLDAAGLGHEFRWLSVDLEPMIALRNKLLPKPDRVTQCAQSALDLTWMDRVDDENGVFITAEGLLMYLQPEEAMSLIRACAQRFPGGQMLFDLPPAFFAFLTRKGLPTSMRYRVPPMPFSLSPTELADLVNTVPGVRAVRDVPMPPGRGRIFNLLLQTYQLALFDPVRPVVGLLEFG